MPALPVVKEPVAHDFAQLMAFSFIDEGQVADFGDKHRVDKCVGVLGNFSEERLSLLSRQAVAVLNAELVESRFGA